MVADQREHASASAADHRGTGAINRRIVGSFTTRRGSGDATTAEWVRSSFSWTEAGNFVERKRPRPGERDGR
jgi:hypothetical protein